MARKTRRGTRGTGSIYRSGNGWIAEYPLGFDPTTGKRLKDRKRLKTKPEAEQELARMANAYAQGFDPEAGTVEDWLAQWLRGHRKPRQSTLDYYAAHHRLHINPYLGRIELRKLRKDQVEAWVAWLLANGRSPALTGKVLTSLRIALNAAVADHKRLDNPAVGVESPNWEPALPTPMTEDRRDAIIATVREHWIGPLVRLLLGSGIRLGEALGLNQGDLDLDGGQIMVWVSKTHQRAVLIDADAVDALREALVKAPRRGPAEPVFFGPRKQRKANGGQRDRLRGDTATHAVTSALKPLGHIHPHDLRHGVGTLLLALGAPQRAIQEQLGHKDGRMTDRYMQVVPQQARAVVDLLNRKAVTA